jgi:hypothetical protein
MQKSVDEEDGIYSAAHRGWKTKNKGMVGCAHHALKSNVMLS